MKEFTVFNEETGQVLRTGVCPDDLIPIQAMDGEQSIEGRFPDEEFYFQESSPIRIPDKPYGNFKWSNIKKAWEEIPTNIITDELIQNVLQKRQILLSGSDWTQLPDVPLETKSAWATYRQALRDITNQPGFPESVLWPNQP